MTSLDPQPYYYVLSRISITKSRPSAETTCSHLHSFELGLQRREGNLYGMCL